MGRRQRFSAVKYLIKTAKKMNISVEEDDNIKAYREYRRGTSKNYKTTPVKRGGSKPVSLIPFCVYDYLNRYMYRMSGRCFNAMAQNGITEGKLNIDTGINDTADAGHGGQRKAGFIPARMHLFVSNGAATTATSGILLTRYTKRSGTSYTYPFGKQNAPNQTNYIQMSGYLLQEYGSGNRVVSFSPERPA